MKNMDMEAKIKQAFEHATPDVLRSVLSDCHEQKGTVIIMKEKKNNWTKRLAAVAAALALVIGLGAGAGLYRTNRAVAATVSLDVNPSVELTVNRKDRILSVNANNEDGKTILGDMDLTGSSLDVAVNALVGSMVRNGYLNELANSVLVSVDSKDAAVGTALQEKLAREISVILEGDSFSGAVISQTVEKTEDLSNQAKEHHISVGKANLIRQIISQDSRYTFEELADRSINELKLISESPAIKLEHASEVGSASEKEYIGREAALQAALAWVDAKAADITGEEIEMDFENGVMVYEVEFILKGMEYDFEIDAKTGNVLTENYERDDDVQYNPPVTTTPTQDSIDAEKAKEFAFNHAGVKADDAKNIKCELDRDDGTVHYDVKFDAGGFEYDYEISAADGKVIKSEKERDDDIPVTTKASVETAADAETLIGKDRAKEIALDHAGVQVSNALNIKCELDRDNGTAHYDVEFDANGYEYDYEINASNGKILKSEKEKDDDAAVKTTKATEAATTETTDLIGKERAKQIALDHAGVKASNARAVECELDRDNGKTVYEVDFVSGGYEYSYEINANNGKVISHEKERND